MRPASSTTTRSPHGQRLGLAAGDVQEGHAEPLADAAQLAAHPGAEVGVERPERFVEQHQGRLRHEGAGEGDALALTARDGGDGAALEPREAHEVDHGPHPVRDGARRGAVVGPVLQPEGDVLLHGQVREQREVLEHEADVAPVGGPTGQRLAAQRHGAGVERLEARDGAQQDGLAPSRWRRAATRRRRPAGRASRRRARPCRRSAWSRPRGAAQAPRLARQLGWALAAMPRLPGWRPALIRRWTEVRRDVFCTQAQFMGSDGSRFRRWFGRAEPL